MNLVHIESRKSKRRNSDFEIFVDCDSGHEQLKDLTQLLRKHTNIVEVEPPDTKCIPEDGKQNPLLYLSGYFCFIVIETVSSDWIFRGERKGRKNSKGPALESNLGACSKASSNVVRTLSGDPPIVFF